MHRRARTLNKELKSAEMALALDDSEENLARLREIQRELQGVEGREAAIEGFGASFGRSDEDV